MHHSDNVKVKKKCYCSIENRCLYIECKERSTVCTIALIFVLPILTPSRNVNEFQNRVMKMLMNMHICTLINVSLLSLSIFKMVLMTWMLTQMKVYLSLLFAEWRIQKCKNRYWIWVTRKCSLLGAHKCIFALLVINSRSWMRILS